MKNLAFITLLLSANIFGSCQKEEMDTEEVNLFPVGMDIQTGLSQDNIEVYVDGQIKLNKQLTTNEVLGVCLGEGQITTSVKEGNHQLKVVVNHSIVRTETFSVTDTLYIGINYDKPASKISVTFSEHRFMYD